MGSTYNPLMLSLVPGANLSGNNTSVPTPATPTGSATNQYMFENNPLMNKGGNSNPYSTSVPGASTATTSTSGFPAYGFGSPSSTGAVPTSSLPTLGTTIPGTTNSNAGTSTYGSNGGPLGLGENYGGMKELQSSLDKTYGAGVGNALTQFLASGAGYSPQVLQQLFAQLQPGFEQQQQNLLQQFSAGGGRFSSPASTGYADLLGQQGLDEGNIASQMYEQAVNNYMNTLGQAGTASANRVASTPSTWDIVSGALGLGSAGANALSTAGVGGSSGGLSTLLSVLGAL